MYPNNLFYLVEILNTINNSSDQKFNSHGIKLWTLASFEAFDEK